MEKIRHLGPASFAQLTLKVPFISPGYFYKWGVAACMWVKADVIYHSEATHLGIDPVLLKGPFCHAETSLFTSLSHQRGDWAGFKTWILSNDTQVP